MKYIIYILPILFFTNLSAQVKVGADGAIHPTGNYPATSLREAKAYALSVQSIDDRDAIPSNYRDTGMMILVRDSSSIYSLVGGITNSDWVLVSSSSGIGSITASNGLTMEVADIQLGGTLTKNTSIQTSNFGLTIQSNLSATPLQTSAQNNVAFSATTVEGQYAAGFSTIPANYDTVYTIVRLANDGGLGGALDFANATSTSTQVSNRLVSIWADTANSSRTSSFYISGINNAAETDLLTLNGDGEGTLNQYGQGNFTSGTPAYVLAVTADGDIMETSVGAATVRLDSVVLDFSGFNADTTFDLTQAGFKNLEIQAESELAGGFQQDFNDTQGILKWQVAIKGSYKFYITYYY